MTWEAESPLLSTWARWNQGWRTEVSLNMQESHEESLIGTNYSAIFKPWIATAENKRKSSCFPKVQGLEVGLEWFP